MIQKAFLSRAQIDSTAGFLHRILLTRFYYDIPRLWEGRRFDITIRPNRATKGKDFHKPLFTAS